MATATWRSRIPQIIAAAEARASQIVAETGFAIEAGAKRRARVDTGFMRGEIRFRQTGPLEGEVVAGAAYTIHHEFGTVHMAAQPMLVPAAEEARPGFEAAISGLYR